MFEWLRSTGSSELSRSCAERAWASFLGPVVFWPLAPGAMAWATGCAVEAGADPGEDGSADFAPTGAAARWLKYPNVCTSKRRLAEQPLSAARPSKWRCQAMTAVSMLFDLCSCIVETAVGASSADGAPRTEDVRIRPITALHVLERVFHVMTAGRLLNPLVASLMGGGGGGCASDAAPSARPFADGLASGVLASPFARSEYPSLWVSSRAIGKAKPCMCCAYYTISNKVRNCIPFP